MSTTPERVQEALDGLWKKFEEQERELDKALIKAAALSKELAKLDSLHNALRAQRDQRDVDIERCRVRIYDLERKIEARRDEMELLDRYLVEDRMAMEAALESVSSLRTDLAGAMEELRVRDYWYDANKGLLAHVADVVKNRQASIDASRMGPVEFEVMGPGLDALLEEAHVPGPARSSIAQKVRDPPSEIVRSSERELAGRYGLGLADAMLLRRALDRLAFRPVPAGVSAIGAAPSGKELKFALWQGPGLKMPGIQVDPALPSDTEEGLAGLSKALYPALCSILDEHASAVERATVLVLQNGGPGGASTVLDLSGLVSDNNALLAVWRLRSRGISLVPGLTGRDPGLKAPSDITKDPVYKDLASRLEVVPDGLIQALKGMGVEAFSDNGALPPHPLVGLVVNAALSYLLQNPKLRFRVLSASLAPSVDAAKVLQAL